MKPVRKKFNQDVYDSSDYVKWLVAATLNRGGHYTLVVEDYSADVKAYHLDKGFSQHEVEMRAVWDWEDFPFETIHIPERKTRLLEYGDFFYWVINKWLTHAMVCNAPEHMTKDRLVEVPNKAVEKGEYFYDIPIEYFKKTRLVNIAGMRYVGD